jgi:uncharacterized protein (DUF1501 family)
MKQFPITRRRFLRHGLAGVSLAATAPHFLDLGARAFAGPPGEPGRVLVVLQLSGGNDGLSTVVPWADAAYHANRNASAIPGKEVLDLDGHIGLHPALTGFRDLFADGRLAVVQGAGYPNPNRSHFKSMDIWHTGDLEGRRRPTGWLGRAIDSCCPADAGPELVVNLGESIPYALEARVHKPVAFDNAASYRWAGNPRDADEFEELNGEAHGGDAVSWLHRVAVDARASSDRIRSAATGYRPKGDYPGTGLARDLRTVAALIAAGLDTRVYYVSFGGFDTHNNQRARHDNLMREWNGAVSAFLAALDAQGLSDRVLLMSFSEFGRRVRENGSAGTDHGVAGPMFLFGKGVRGGLHAEHPSLTDLDQGDLKMRVDFRSVYAAVLERWLGADPSMVLGARFEPLPVL